MSKTGKYQSISTGFGDVFKTHGIKYLNPLKCNYNSCLYAALGGSVMCYMQDNMRDWSRIVSGFTWGTFTVSALVGTVCGLSLGQAGIVGKNNWNRQETDPKFRMLDGSKIQQTEIDANRSLVESIGQNSLARFAGARSTFFHHGPLFFLTLLIAENFGLFDRNYVSTGNNPST